MNRTRFISLVALSFVVYIAASAGAAQVSFDGGQVFALCVALVLAFTPAFTPRGETSEAATRVGFLGAAISLSLASFVARGLFALAGELSLSLLLPFAGLTLLELALTAPEVPPRLARHVRSLGFLRWLALCAALLGVVAALPPIWLFGRALIAPSAVAAAPYVFVLSSATLALGIRSLRRRFGSDARALAANLWPLLGISAAAVLGVLAFVIARRGLGVGYADACTALAAFSVALGHVWLVSPRRALSAGPLTRAWLATASALVMSLVIALAFETVWPSDPLLRVGALTLLLLLFAVLRSFAVRVVHDLVAPAQGRLLKAIAEARAELADSASLDDLAARVLRPLRRAALLPEASPLLYTMHPAHELRLDAAGQPQARARALPAAIAKQLDRVGLVPIVRGELSALLVRRPELREVLHALDEVGASVVLPLVAQGELEGVLFVAAGARRSALTLEELTQLDELGRSLAAMISVLSARERAHVRAQEAVQRAEGLAIELDDMAHELQRTRTQFQALVAGDTAERKSQQIVAYGAAMRSLLERLEHVAPHDVPIALMTEVGMSSAPLAQLVHEASGRVRSPFVVMDCAALSADEAQRRLFGAQTEDTQTPGLIELADGGTLVLYDVTALSLSAQRALASALGERRTRREGSDRTYPFQARLIVTLRAEPTDLVAAGVLAPQLVRWLEPTSYRVPPLRERPEDLESLLMIAVDRAARVSGRLVPGVTPEALRALSEHTWPGNESELENVMTRAVLACRGPRITLADLPQLPAAGAIHQGSFVDQEREILRRALERAGGNKTRAARALGLKRTTLVDKLKRHALDDAEPDTKH